MVLEYRVNWSYGGGSPGVTVLHGRPSGVISDQDAAEELALRARTLFSDLDDLFYGTFIFSFPGEAVELNTATGVLEDVYTFTPPAGVNSSGTGTYAAPVGARIEWQTPAIVAGRRLRGRTFLVPIIASRYDTDGSLSSGTVDLIQAAADAYYDASILSDCNPCVWSRTHGILADITAAIVPDESTVLRSRRD